MSIKDNVKERMDEFMNRWLQMTCSDYDYRYRNLCVMLHTMEFGSTDTPEDVADYNVSDDVDGMFWFNTPLEFYPSLWDKLKYIFRKVTQISWIDYVKDGANCLHSGNLGKNSGLLILDRIMQHTDTFWCSLNRVITNTTLIELCKDREIKIPVGYTPCLVTAHMPIKSYDEMFNIWPDVLQTLPLIGATDYPVICRMFAALSAAEKRKNMPFGWYPPEAGNPFTVTFYDPAKWPEDNFEVKTGDIIRQGGLVFTFVIENMDRFSAAARGMEDDDCEYIL